jgi:autotransporter-associated beta strand protein
MKPRHAILPVCFTLAASSIHAADVTWDITPGTVGAGDSAITGGGGTWNTSNGNWTTDGGANNVAWSNGSNDTAVFGGTAGTVTIDTLDDLGVTVGGLTFSTANYIIAGAAGETLTFGAAGNISNGVTATISAVVAGSATITKTGAGTLNLTALNTFTGHTVISGGTLVVGGNNTAATLGPANYAGNITNNGTLLQFTNSTSQNLSGIISGSGTLQKGGSGTLTLSGANTYTGKTIIAASGAGGPTLSVSSLNSVNSDGITPGIPSMTSSSLGAPTTVANGTIQLGSGTNVRSATLIYTGSGETTDRVMNVNFNSGAKHTITNNATGGGLLKFTSNFTINPSSGTTTGGLTLRGSGKGEVAQIGTIPGILEKADGGIWTIGGTNGANSVNVSGGKLLINGTYNVTTTVGVASGATLGGSGTVGGAITVNNGGTLAPGNSAGQFTVGNSLALAATSNTVMELGGTTLGTGYDNVTINILGVLTYGGNLNVVNFGVYDMDAASFTYDLFSLGATTSGSFASVTVNSVLLSNSGGLWTGSNGDVDYSFAQSTGDLTITAIPEPAAALLGGLGLLTLLRRRRA